MLPCARADQLFAAHIMHSLTSACTSFRGKRLEREHISYFVAAQRAAHLVTQSYAASHKAKVQKLKRKAERMCCCVFARTRYVLLHSYGYPSCFAYASFPLLGFLSDTQHASKHRCSSACFVSAFCLKQTQGHRCNELAAVTVSDLFTLIRY